jgi:hypothetical protein
VGLTITADDKTKVYGAALPTLTASYDGFVNGDTSASLTTQPTLSTNATAASHVGNYTITVSGAADNDYTISYVNGILSVTTAALTIMADNKTKVYGVALPTLTASYNGFVNGDTSASLTTAPSLSTSATAASHVGNYTITANGAVDSDYTISYANGTLSVTAVALTITADDKSKAYGAALPMLTASYNGFVNGDDASSLTTAPTLNTSATAASHVNTYTITASGADDGDYTISYVNGTLTVTPVALTITADDKSKAYGAALPMLTASYNGFINDDDASSLTTAPTLSTTATAASHVNTYTITASGAADSDYTISYVNGALTVTPVLLTITADDKSKAYGAVLPMLTASYNGFVNGDDASSLTTAPTLSTSATAASHVKSYTITARGAVDNDYTIGYVNGNLTVTPVALMITADDRSKAYGAALPTLTASYDGLVNGDTSASLTTAPTLSTTATAASHVNTYTITASGAADSDYTISYVNGTLTVTPVALTITADDTSKVYGAALPTLTASYDGFINGDTSTSLTTQPMLSTSATAASHVNTYPITAGSALDGDYTISYVNGTLTVTPAALTITADDRSKVYGAALPIFTASYSGLVNGDTATSLTTAPSLDTSATAASHVGSYAITASGAVDTDYTISYVAGTLTVTPATPSITWPNPADIVHGTALGAAQLDATADTGGSFSYTLADGTTPANGVVLNAGNGQRLNVAFSPTDTTDYTSASDSALINVKAASQSILFDVSSPVVFGTPVSLSASGGASGNPVTFRVVSGPATLAGNTLAFTNIGNVVVEADQPGNANYTDAPAVQQTIVVVPSYQVTTSEKAAGKTTVITISSLLHFHYNDADKYTRPGIAIVALSGSGVWQYSQGSTWRNISAVSLNSALLLPQSDRLRFVPAGLATQTAGLLFIGWDGSLGSSAGRANVSGPGNTSPFSTHAGLLVVNVTPAIHAPVWLASTTTLTPIPSGTINPAGESVASAFGSVFSGDNNQSAGIAVVGTTGKGGTWEYELYNSATQTLGAPQNMPKVSAGKALLLGPNDEIFFMPGGGFSGLATLLVRAWDGSPVKVKGSTAGDGGTVNLMKTGTAGKTDFSSSILTARQYFNDAPTQSPAGPVQLFAPGIAENMPSKPVSVAALLADVNAADPDNNVLGLALTGVSGNGTWQYELPHGAWQLVPSSLSEASALLLPSGALLRFNPTVNESGDANLSWLAWDRTQGTAGQLFSVSGGVASAFSSASTLATAKLTVIPSQHAPAWNGSGAQLMSVLPGTTSPQGNTVASVFGTFFEDPNATAMGIAVSGVTGTKNGQWYYSIDNGASWQKLPAVSAARALLLLGTDLMAFVPKAGFVGTATLTAHAWDGNGFTHGTAANLAAKGARGGTTHFSSTTFTATCLVNHSPTLG